MSTPSTPEAPPAPLTAEFVEKARKVGAVVHPLGPDAGYGVSTIAKATGLSIEFLRNEGERIAEHQKLVFADDSFYGREGEAEPDLFEALYNGTVDGEAFDGDPADLW